MPTDGCPATGGISPGPLNGARRKKDLNTPAAGLAGNQGLKHPVHRPALPARDLNTPRQQLSLVGQPCGKGPG